MSNKNEPAAESQVISALARAFHLKSEDILVPVLQAKSLLMGSRSHLAEVETSISEADVSSGPGMLDMLKAMGGIVMLAEGISIAGNATKIGVAVVSVLGVTVSPAVAAVVAVGLIVIGGYLAIKGIQALWPFIRERLMREFGEDGFKTVFG